MNGNGDVRSHTLSVLVENHAGVLSHIAGLFARRGFNIDSLAVGMTENPRLSRMTIVGEGDDHILEQVEKQLNKLIPVIKVRSLGDSATQAELLLIKIGRDTQTLGEVNEIAALMKAEVVDVGKNTITLKFAGEHDKCATLCDLLKPYGIREIARTGVIALERGG